MHLRIAGLLKLYCRRFWRFAIWTFLANFIRRMWNQELNFCCTVFYFTIPSSLAFFINMLPQTSLARYANNKKVLIFRAFCITNLWHFANWTICVNIHVFIQHCIKFNTWLQLSKIKIRATIQSISTTVRERVRTLELRPQTNIIAKKIWSFVIWTNFEDFIFSN